MKNRLFFYGVCVALEGWGSALGAATAPHGPIVKAAQPQIKPGHPGVKAPQPHRVVCPGAPSQAPYPVIKTLKESFEQAYQFNPDLQMAQVALRRAKEGIAQARGEWLPSVEATASQTGQPVSRPLRNGANQESFSGEKAGSVSASLPVFSGGATYARTQSAQKNVKAAEAALLVAEQKMFQEVLKAYLDVCTGKQKLDIGHQDEERCLEVLNSAEARASVGDVTVVELSQAQAELAAAKGRVAAYEAELEGARATFVNVVGTEAAPDLEWPHLNLDMSKNAKDALAIALKMNPNIVASLLQEEAARYDVNAELGSRMLPSVVVDGSLQRQSQYGDQQAPDVYTGTQFSKTARITLRVPLSLGVQQSQVRVKEHDLSKARLERQKNQLGVRQAVIQLWAQAIAAEQSIVQFQLELEASTIGFKQAQEEYEVKSKTMLDVLTLKEKILQSNLRLLDARSRAVLLEAQKAGMLGQFGAKDLKILVNYYDSNAYSPWFGLGVDQQPQPLRAAEGG